MDITFGKENSRSCYISSTCSFGFAMISNENINCLDSEFQKKE